MKAEVHSQCHVGSSPTILTKNSKKMTDFETKVIDFIKSSEKNRRYLCSFYDLIPVLYNQRYEWQIRGSILAKMVKKGVIKSDMDRPPKGMRGRRNRQTIYFYL